MNDTKQAMGKEGQSEITHGTKIPLGMAVGMLATAITATTVIIGAQVRTAASLEAMIAANKNEAREATDKIKSEVQALRKQGDDAWTRQNQEIFALRLKLGNPQLTVPEIRDIPVGKGQ